MPLDFADTEWDEAHAINAAIQYATSSAWEAYLGISNVQITNHGTVTFDGERLWGHILVSGPVSVQYKDFPDDDDDDDVCPCCGQ